MPIGVLAATAVAGVGVAAAAAIDPTDGRELAGMPAEDRFLLRRFSYGINGRLASQVRNLGGARPWLAQQLDAASIDDSVADEMTQWYPTLLLTPQQMWSRATSSEKTLGNTTAADDLARWTLMRRAFSQRQVHEVMVEFWSNLLHVPAPQDKCWPHRSDFDRTIRANALGRFDDLLQATVLHPAMLLYLDNYESTKDAPNENLGREVLECHTVGRQTNYTETDVLNSTRILTGWAVDRSRSWNASYNAEGHFRGAVRVMDFSDDNGSADGVQTTYAYLRYLAHHPATAQRIANRLVTRFVSDNPAPALVDAVAAAYTASGTDIRQTLRAMINHPLFLSSAAPKVRTPSEDFIATLRALRVQPERPHADTDLGLWCVWTSTNVGQRPFDWPTPDGMPDSDEAWSSTTRMLGSWTMHQNLASKGTPGAEYKDYDVWLPQIPARFEDIVNHASRRILYEDPSPALLEACCDAVGQRPNDVITTKSRFPLDRVQLLLACLLDSPLHMKR